jgi:methionine-gamma-lyase
MSTSTDKLHPPTQVLTKGFDPALSVGSARPAVFRTSTFVFPTPEAAERAFDIVGGRAKPSEGESPALIYSRFNHPNAEILEDQTTPLEPGAEAALVFNSGMSAIMNTLMGHLKPGGELIYTVPIYGGTQKLIQNFLQQWGVKGVPVKGADATAIAAAIAASSAVQVVLVETPANPNLVMTDMKAVSAACHAHQNKPVLMVDNTMMGPAFQHPLLHGADIVLYSATKYLSGFSDLLGGFALAKNKDHLTKVRSLRNLFGTILQADECWILNGRLPTVGLRMKQAQENAQLITAELVKHPKVERVLYPTYFTDGEQKRIYEAQCTGPGAMFSLEVKGGKAAAFNFQRHVKIARTAVSLGGVETLVCHPKSTTHSGFTDEEFRIAGVTDSLLRFSIGVEDWRDLARDFINALDHS